MQTRSQMKKPRHTEVWPLLFALLSHTFLKFHLPISCQLSRKTSILTYKRYNISALFSPQIQYTPKAKNANQTRLWTWCRSQVFSLRMLPLSPFDQGTSSQFPGLLCILPLCSGSALHGCCHTQCLFTSSVTTQAPALSLVPTTTKIQTRYKQCFCLQLVISNALVCCEKTGVHAFSWSYSLKLVK